MALKTGMWRRAWLNTHLWIGAGLLIVLAPLGLSGSALVWDVQLDRLLNPNHYVVPGDAPRLPASAYLAAGQAAFGDRAQANQVRYPFGPGDPVVVNGREPRPVQPGRPPKTLNAWLDPANGAVLDMGDPRASAVGNLHRLHGNLLLPVNGHLVVGWLGLAMTVSCLTGLWLWWPKGPFLKGLMAGVRWRRGPNIFSNLHHLGGFWISIPLFVLSTTGAYIAFPKITHAMVGLPPPVAPQGGAGQGGGSGSAALPRLTLDEAVAAVLRARPGARLVTISTPTGSGSHSIWRVQIAGAGTNPVALMVDDASATVREGHAPAASPQVADPLSRQIRQIHTGDDTPLAWKTVITLVGVAPTLLGVTGVVIWLRRPRAPKLTRRIA